ncbi:MAG: C40 family peptidase [Bacteroidetes bacterium]|nr:C40 family peptidase [Bacteroidota bacterium]
MRGFFFILLIIISLDGCGQSSPRYQTETSTTKKPEKKSSKKHVLFSSANVEEELKNDDIKVNVKDVSERFTSSSSKTNIVTSPNIETQKMMDVILSYLGTPYKFGGESKSGMDCSAFTKEVFSQTSVFNLPRSTAEQIKIGSEVEKENLKFGDLIFFNTTGVNPSHVGIYIGDNMFAHASQTYGVTISSFESSYYKKNFTEARRIVK